MNSLNAAGRAFGEMSERKEMAKYQHKAQTLGRPRLASDEVRELVARHATDTVARSMIVFATGGAVHNLWLHPYFWPDPVPPPPPRTLLDLIDAIGSEIYLGTAFLAFMLLANIADSSTPVRTIGLLILASGLTGLGLLRRHDEKRKAKAQDK